MAVSLAEEAYLDPLAARSEQNEAMEDPLTGGQFIERAAGCREGKTSTWDLWRAGVCCPGLSCGYHLPGTMSSPDPSVQWRKNLAGSSCTVCLSYIREMGTMTATAGQGLAQQHGVCDDRREGVGLGLRRAFSRRQ